MVKTHAYSYYTYYNYFLTPCLSPLDFWSMYRVSLEFFSISNSKKNWFRNKLDFLSSSNLIFTACVACKNQVWNRQKIEFVSKSIFFSWVCNKNTVDSWFRKTPLGNHQEGKISFINLYFFEKEVIPLFICSWFF